MSVALYRMSVLALILVEFSFHLYMGWPLIRSELGRIGWIICMQLWKHIHMDAQYDTETMTNRLLHLEGSTYYVGLAIFKKSFCSSSPLVDVGRRTLCGYSPAMWLGRLSLVIASIILFYNLSGIPIIDRALIKANIFVFGSLSTAYDLMCGALLRVGSKYGSFLESKTSGMPLYQQKPLQENEIRLLQVHRRFPFFPVRATVLITTLEQAPPYEAISYTWGKTGGSRRIMLDGQTYRVSTATYDSLCNRSSVWRSRVLWIDYACVNQQDRDEKAIQVGKMVDIYNKADMVSVILGNSRGSLMALLALHRLFVLHKAKWSANRMYRHFEKQNGGLFWEALVELLKNPWFTRVWVIQEVAVARKVQVIYGPIRYSWADFSSLATIFQSTEMSMWLQLNNEGGQARSNLTNLANIDGARMLRQISRFLDLVFEPVDRPTASSNPSDEDFVYGELVGQRVRLEKSLSLSYLLPRFNRFDATDPRDHVYALQGLGLEGSDSSIKLKPDYGASTERLYVQVARVMWSNPDNFYFVCQAGIGHGRNLQLLPSWVPDWTSAPLAHELNAAALPTVPGFTSILPNILIPDPFTAGGKDTAEVSFDPVDPELLIVTGLLVDEVASLTCVGERKEMESLTDTGRGIAYSKTQWELLIQWHDDALKMASEVLSKKVSKTAQEREDIFWRAIICDTTLYGRPAPPEVVHGYRLYKRQLEKMRKVCFGNDGDTEWMIDDPVWRENGSLFAFTRYLSRATFGRRFCTTKGGSLGLVPPGTEIGDAVLLAKGAATPWLLRPAGNSNQRSSLVDANQPGKHYHLVGDCYMYGWMDGEKMESQSAYPVRIK